MIRLKDLDGAYAQTVQLLDTENNDGVELLNQFETLINGLKDHWIGKDGTNHINRMIEVHEKLQKFLATTLENTRDAMTSVVQVQEVRRSNGGGGDVGDIKSVNTEFMKSFARVEDTAEYYIDPAIQNDYKQLETVAELLKGFNSKVNARKGDLMENWIDGSNRDQTNANFETLDQVGKEAEKILAEVKQDLGTAINNASQIMD